MAQEGSSQNQQASQGECTEGEPMTLAPLGPCCPTADFRRIAKSLKLVQVGFTGLTFAPDFSSRCLAGQALWNFDAGLDPGPGRF